MMLTDLTGLPDAALPVAHFSDHLHLGRGFADDGSQDALLRSYLRAAMAAVEARIGKVLIRRNFSLQLEGWREPDAQPLPVAPVQTVASVTITDRAGSASVVAPERYALRRDALRPRVAATGSALPMVPAGGSVEIVFEAGYGADWDGVPVDLRQAVLLLAAHFHENRAAAGEGMPFGVMALIEHYRTVRTLGAPL
jgi:uncharacterized phiE125 gp8 family phage protein